MFLEFTDGTIYKAYYDDESYEWKIVESEEKPDFSASEGDENFFYPYSSYLPEQHNQGIGYLGVKLSKNSIKLNFEKGYEMELRFNPESESNEIRANT